MSKYRLRSCFADYHCHCSATAFSLHYVSSSCHPFSVSCSSMLSSDRLPSWYWAHTEDPEHKIEPGTGLKSFLSFLGQGVSVQWRLDVSLLTLNIDKKWSDATTYVYPIVFHRTVFNLTRAFSWLNLTGVMTQPGPGSFLHQHQPAVTGTPFHFGRRP